MSYTFKWIDPSVVFQPGTKPKIRRTNGEYNRTQIRNLGHGLKFPCVVFRNRCSENEIPIFDLTDESKAKLDKKHPGWREVTKEKKKEATMRQLT